VSAGGLTDFQRRQRYSREDRRQKPELSDHQAILLQRLGLNLPKNLPPTNKILKKNVVKTFSVFKPKSTIYTPNCGTWVKTGLFARFQRHNKKSTSKKVHKCINCN